MNIPPACNNDNQGAEKPRRNRQAFERSDRERGIRAHASDAMLKRRGETVDINQFFGRRKSSTLQGRAGWKGLTARGAQFGGGYPGPICLQHQGVRKGWHWEEAQDDADRRKWPKFIAGANPLPTNQPSNALTDLNNVIESASRQISRQQIGKARWTQAVKKDSYA